MKTRKKASTPGIKREGNRRGGVQLGLTETTAASIGGGTLLRVSDRLEKK